MPEPIQIGHLLTASTTSFIAGCSVAKLEYPAFGSLVRAPVDQNLSVFGLIHDIHIEDDGLVRQLVTSGEISSEVIRDSRERRIVPVEMSVLIVGCEKAGKISHLLPPRPPLSLDAIYLCPDAELIHFTSSGRFGYFRHILRAVDLPVAEILAAHIHQARQAHQKNNNTDWFATASQELITLLRDDYPTLMSVLGALGDSLTE